jgi:hypothetical protein
MSQINKNLFDASFRGPTRVKAPYTDRTCIITSKDLHAMLLRIFYRAAHSHNKSENLLALAAFLLEIAIDYTNDETVSCSTVDCASGGASTPQNISRDIPALLNCFPRSDRDVRLSQEFNNRLDLLTNKIGCVSNFFLL